MDSKLIKIICFLFILAVIVNKFYPSQYQYGCVPNKKPSNESIALEYISTYFDSADIENTSSKNIYHVENTDAIVSVYKLNKTDYVSLCNMYDVNYPIVYFTHGVPSNAQEIYTALASATGKLFKSDYVAGNVIIVKNIKSDEETSIRLDDVVNE